MLKGLQLTILAGPAVPVPLPAIFVDALESVSASTGDSHGFELKFILDRRSPLPTLLTVAGANLPDFRVILVATMRGFPHVVADGIVTQHQVDSSQQQPRLVIQGTSVAAVMDREDRTNEMQFPCLPPSERVRSIFVRYLKYGVIPAAVPAFGNTIPNPMKTTPLQKGTDLKYVEHLAEAAGNDFFILPGPAPGTNLAYWGPPIRLGVPQPPLNADMDVHRNVESLTFKINNEQHTLPEVQIQEPFTKVSFSVPIPAFSPLVPPMGIVRPPGRRTDKVSGAAKHDFADALSKGFAMTSKMQDIVSAEGTLNVLRYGHVLRPKALVTVRGATHPFDGMYFVDNVTHSIERGKYTQSFRLVRDALVSSVPVIPMVS